MLAKVKPVSPEPLPINEEADTAANEAEVAEISPVPRATSWFTRAATAWAEPDTVPVPSKIVAAVIEPPNDVSLPAIVIPSLASLLLAIDPAKSSFTTAPVKFNLLYAIAASDFTSALTITPAPIAAVPLDAIVTSPVISWNTWADCDMFPDNEPRDIFVSADPSPLKAEAVTALSTFKFDSSADEPETTTFFHSAICFSYISIIVLF